VVHSQDEYYKDGAGVQSAEAFFAILKRGVPYSTHPSVFGIFDHNSVAAVRGVLGVNSHDRFDFPVFQLTAGQLPERLFISGDRLRAVLYVRTQIGFCAAARTPCRNVIDAPAQCAHSVIAAADAGTDASLAAAGPGSSTTGAVSI